MHRNKLSSIFRRPKIVSHQFPEIHVPSVAASFFCKFHIFFLSLSSKKCLPGNYYNYVVVVVTIWQWLRIIHFLIMSISSNVFKEFFFLRPFCLSVDCSHRSIVISARFHVWMLAAALGRAKRRSADRRTDRRTDGRTNGRTDTANERASERERERERKKPPNDGTFTLATYSPPSKL